VKTSVLLCAALGLALSTSASALCPWNTSYDSSLNFCTDANNAFGPFTRAMTTACTNGGNGSACTGTVNVFYNGTSTTGIAVPVQRWGKSLASSLRGTGTCPSGSVVSANYDGRCVESTTTFGTEVYGPFPQNYIDACRAAPISAGNACFLNRWSATVYSSVRTQVTPTANWKLPMPSGFTSSDWCVCRNIGTSPHIGWDLVNNGSMTSVAIESGKITRGPLLNGSCGWELELTDRFGTVWYYRHLNQPSLSNGQSITAGATIGLHRDYPGSSCGSGPHLHFERLSAGFFKDSSVSKNCTGVATSCNFDPRKPFPQFKSAVANPLAVIDQSARAAIVELDDSTIARNQVCRLDPASYELEAPTVLTGLQALPSTLQVSLNASERTGALGYTGTILSLAASFQGNAGNVCKAGSCITSVAIYAQTTDGNYARVLSDATVRNSEVNLSADSAFCAPANSTGKYVVKVTDREGMSYRADF
jgi:hypothetical protein